MLLSLLLKLGVEVVLGVGVVTLLLLLCGFMNHRLLLLCGFGCEIMSPGVLLLCGFVCEIMSHGVLLLCGFMCGIMSHGVLLQSVTNEAPSSVTDLAPQHLTGVA